MPYANMSQLCQWKMCYDTYMMPQSVTAGIDGSVQMSTVPRLRDLFAMIGSYGTADHLRVRPSWMRTGSSVNGGHRKWSCSNMVVV